MSFLVQMGAERQNRADPLDAYRSLIPSRSEIRACVPRASPLKVVSTQRRYLP